MRTCEKNKVKIWYSNGFTETEVKDSDGNYTGETEKLFETPVGIKLPLYPSDGKITKEVFGEAARLDLVTVTMGNPFNKDTVFYLTEPTGDYANSYDYSVELIKPSLNSTYYGLTKRI